MNYAGKRIPSFVNWTIIGLNIVYFLWLETIASTESADIMLQYGAAYAPYIFRRGEYWRLLTSIFMHFGISHITNNMLVLFMLGDNMERALGHIKYIIFYLICGIGANIVSLYYYAGKASQNVSAGASGAIFGVVGGLLWAVIRNRGKLEDLTTGKMLLLLGLTLYFGFTSTGVDNAAHVGGAIIGFLLSIVMYRKRPKRIYTENFDVL